MVEEWKVAYFKNIETDALISNFGNIMFRDELYRSKYKVPIVKQNRHYYARIHVNGKRHNVLISRLVAKAFIPIPQKYIDLGLTEDDLEVDHIDANHKEDNSINNLQWLTPYENKMKAKVNKEHVYCEDRPNTIITNKQVKKVCEFLQENKKTIYEISVITGVPTDTIYHIKRHDIWTEISDMYDIDNYSVISGRSNTQESIHHVCKLLQDKIPRKEISEITGVGISLIHNIGSKQRWTSISKYYNI